MKTKGEDNHEILRDDRCSNPVVPCVVLADLSRLPPEDEGSVLISESTESATYLPRDVRLHKL